MSEFELTPEDIDTLARKIPSIDGLDGDEKQLLIGALAIAYADFLPGAEVSGFAASKCTCKIGGSRIGISPSCPIHGGFFNTTW